jgi:protein gp37
MYRDMARTPFDPNVVTRAKPVTFNAPLKWRDPARVFTCSWSDFWIEEADAWREEALQIIAQTPHLTYQILTKRPERIGKTPIGINGLPPNLWIGVSVENQKEAHKRIWQLCQIPAAVRFISAEPLLGMVDLGFDAWLTDEMGDPIYEKVGSRIDWVITGGESGAAAKIRRAEPEWFRFIKNQCIEFGIPFFHKQNGGSIKIDSHWGGRELDGCTWNQFPAVENVSIERQEQGV